MKHYSEFEYPEMKIIKRKDGIQYLNYAVSFDIETTSFIDENGEKQAYCYLWGISFFGSTVYGRTLDEFKDFILCLVRHYNINVNRRLVIYVHNLAFEFQFIRKYFNWIDIFARAERKPLKAVTENGIEFRCSYMLSGLKLEKVAENLTQHKIKKLVGDLDYSLLRHSETPLTSQELEYLENDVLIVSNFIEEEMTNNRNNITKIPMTKTGYVRRDIRNTLRKSENFPSYNRKIRKATPNEDLFILLNKAYMGGYTHSNAKYTGRILNNVHSIDFTSSYPAVMILEEYPYKFHKLDITSLEQFNTFISKYACVFDICFTNLKAKTTHTILSGNKCELLENPVIDNGRIFSASKVVTYMTEQDYFNMQDYYTWDSIKVNQFYWSKKEKLPLEIRTQILKYFTGKTSLKGIDNKKAEYMVAKGMLNGIYGMTVTNPVAPVVQYADEWTTADPNIEQVLDDISQDKNTVLLYQWGVYVTAYARRNLLKFMKNLQADAVYCDTDSIKFLNYEKHKHLIDEYNNNIILRFEQECKELNYTIPCTPKGKKAYLGVWDYEGMYNKFKTLGAKRYIVEKGDKLEITISGLSKDIGGKYIEMQDNPFEFFNDNMYIPPEHTGKLTHTYIDDEYNGFMIDYKGNKCLIHSPSSVHLCSQEYQLGISAVYKNFIHIVEYSPSGIPVNPNKHEKLKIGAEHINNGKK